MRAAAHNRRTFACAALSVSLVACGASASSSTAGPHAAPVVASPVGATSDPRTTGARASEPPTPVAEHIPPRARCLDGSGPPPVSATELLPVAELQVANGQGTLTALTEQERLRRVAQLEARNPGFAITLGEFGQLLLARTTYMPCSTAERLATQHSPLFEPGVDDVVFVAVFAARNYDVVENPAIVDFRADFRYEGGAYLAIGSQLPVPNATRIAAALPCGRTDAELLRTWSSARILLDDVNRGDSCGPGCGPPPVAVTPILRTAVSAQTVTLQRGFLTKRTNDTITFRPIVSISPDFEALAALARQRRTDDYRLEDRLQRASAHIVGGPSSIDCTTGRSIDRELQAGDAELLMVPGPPPP